MSPEPSITLNIVSVLPRLLDTNGDAANARVLARRARWAGLDATVLAVENVEEVPAEVDLVVIGSGTDTGLTQARDALLPLADVLRRWIDAGIPVLAVGTGWELLSEGLDLADGTAVSGLGIVPGRAGALQQRVTDDIVVTTPSARLIGFENHARGYAGATEPLGAVHTGTGNGDGSEGMIFGSFVGTHLHGPVLARNPELADRLLEAACASRGYARAGSGQAAAVDDIAKAARNQVAVRLGLAPE